MSEIISCQFCGAAMRDAGAPIGLYCPNGMRCPGLKKVFAEQKKDEKREAHTKMPAQVLRDEVVRTVQLVVAGMYMKREEVSPEALILKLKTLDGMPFTSAAVPYVEPVK